MRLSKTITALVAALALMVAAPSAFAQGSSSENGYSLRGGVVQTQLDTPNGGGGNPSTSKAKPVAAVRDTSSPSRLPFTGLDVALIVAAGGMLLLLGFGIRRLSRPTGAV